MELAEVDIHIRRVNEPTGVNNCNSFTTEGKGDIPDGYPMSCANCSNVADEEKCPFEPRIQIYTIKVDESGASIGRHLLDLPLRLGLGNWKVTNLIGRETAT